MHRSDGPAPDPRLALPFKGITAIFNQNDTLTCKRDAALNAHKPLALRKGRQEEQQLVEAACVNDWEPSCVPAPQEHIPC